MKKGLITVVGTILLAIAGRGYANAPVIQNVPDVIISDKEDTPVGATVDNNFFRYLNAFNIMNYTTDSDTTPTSLLFAFKEQTAINNLMIGGALQLANSNTPSANWRTEVGAVPGQRMKTSGGNFYIDFRDILRSPGTGTGPFADPKDAAGNTITSTSNGVVLPWSTTALNTLAGSSRQVEIFVADDNDNQDSDTILVYSVNENATGKGDGFSGTFNKVMEDTTFLSANWVWTNYGLAYAPATSSGSAGAGYLGLTSTATGTGGACFARWITASTGTLGLLGAIPFAEGNVIYCAKLKLQLTAAQSNAKAQAPDFRFGSENGLQQLTVYNFVNSYTFGEANAAISDTYNNQLPAINATPREYALYWSQQQNARGYNLLASYTGDGVTNYDLRRWRLFFDVVDVNTGTTLEDSGTWKISSVVVGTLQRPTDLAAGNTNKTTISSFTAAGGWQVAPGFTGNTATITPDSPSAGKITFNAPGGSVALWEKPAAAPWINGKVVRAVANLSCPTDANRLTFATARIRHQTAGGLVSQVFIVRRDNQVAGLASSAPLVPDTTANGGTNYEVYVPSYGGPAAAVAALANGTKFTGAFDQVPNGAGDTATAWVVNSLQYEVLDDPLP